MSGRRLSILVLILVYGACCCRPECSGQDSVESTAAGRILDTIATGEPAEQLLQDAPDSVVRQLIEIAGDGTHPRHC